MRAFVIVEGFLALSTLAAVPVACSSDSGQMESDAASGGAVAGGGSGGSTTVGQPLCDGSSGMRLAVTSGGGFVESHYNFVTPYGEPFLFVDGQCDFWISTDLKLGIRTGTLSTEQAARLEVDVAWAALPELAGSDESCPDAGSQTIQRPGAVVECSCGCDTEAKTTLFSGMGAVLEGLWSKGEGLDGPLRAMLGEGSVVEGGTPWPLDWPMTDIDMPSVEEIYTSKGTLIEDAADRAALRALRAESSAQVWSSATGVEFEGQLYDLYLRDELPAEVVEALQSFDE